MSICAFYHLQKQPDIVGMAVVAATTAARMREGTYPKGVAS